MRHAHLRRWLKAPLLLAIPLLMVGHRALAGDAGPPDASDDASQGIDAGIPEGGANDIQLLLGFSAKETCSCAFDVGQTDTYCTAFGQQPGYTVTIAINHTTQIVTASILGITRTAHVASPATGCLLDAL